MASRHTCAISLGVGLALCAGAAAQGMSATEYRAARKTVESDFRTARSGCEPMLGNVKDICFADVVGREAIALAELESAYRPGPATSHELRLARAQAAFAVARERCDDQPPAKREACLADARGAHVAARADSEARLANPSTVVEAKKDPEGGRGGPERR